MKIHNNDSNSDNLRYKRKGAKNSTNQEESSARFRTNDTAKLSKNSFAVRKVSDAILAAPDVRVVKIESLRESILNKTYRISPDIIADKLIDASLNKLI